jgi:sugar lactone lactonase YvrE
VVRAPAHCALTNQPAEWSEATLILQTADNSVVPAPRITAIAPLWAVEGGRVAIRGEHLLPDPDVLPAVRVGDVEARILCASDARIDVAVPAGVDGRVPVRVDGVPGSAAYLDVGTLLATGVHQVDNPVFDRRGTLYATFSGTRSHQSAVTIYRIYPDRAREPFVTTIAHPTSMTVAPDGTLYVSDRFEGAIYRVDADGRSEAVATDLGSVCGLTFGNDGSMYAGDRSGPIVRIDPEGVRTTVAELPASVAAFHLAWGPDDCLYATAPSLNTCDPVYRITAEGAVDRLPVSFGRPQGIAFDRLGRLYVCEALAGSAGIYRVAPDRPVPELVLSTAAIVGLAFDPAGGLVVASNEEIHRLEVVV